MSAKHNRLDCEEIRELLPLYALDALTHDERRLLAQGLRQCPELRAEWESYRSLRERFYYSARPVKPAPELRERILASAAVSPGIRVSTVRPRATKQSWWRWVAAVLAAALVITNAAWLWIASDRNAPPRSTHTPLTSGVISRIEISSKPTEASLSWITLEGQRSWIVWFESQSLRQPSPGAQYQLWLLRDGEPPLRVGSLSAVSGTLDGVIFEITEPIRSFDTFQLTEESDINTTTPTGNPVLSVDL